jgi:alkanesulfonate monooxygenase SsuD/methylene tetrahydromethanopterin reductase-like flavin-dependent oxidoreductase (luciferase family)
LRPALDDLLSQGRAEMIVGRGSSIEAFPLFGLPLAEYDSLFANKLDLLLKIRDNQSRTNLTDASDRHHSKPEGLDVWLW